MHFLQLGFWRLEGWHEEISDVPSCLVEVETHALAAETLGYDVELNANVHVSYTVFGSSVVLIKMYGRVPENLGSLFWEKPLVGTSRNSSRTSRNGAEEDVNLTCSR